MAFTATQRKVHQRTELVNALRACLYEYGHVVPQGIGQIRRIEVILDAPHNDLPGLMREECRDLLEQIAALTARIDARNAKIKALSAERDMARRLRTVSGVGLLTALAIEAFAPPMENFRCGRILPLGSASFHASSLQVAKNGLDVFPRQGRLISAGC